ncbi:MAG: type II toxin-antitoxin system VapC family toxin [Cyanobacteria bacterium P01_D01_bin.56]
MVTGYLLDTNVLSELQKPHANAAVTAWYAHVDDTALYLSTLTLGEIRAGIVKVTNSNSDLAEHLADWIEVTRTQFKRRILPVTERIADCWGTLIAHDRQHSIDALLCATAKTHGLTLVTRNIKHVAHHPVDIINPWDFAP